MRTLCLSHPLVPANSSIGKPEWPLLGAALPVIAVGLAARTIGLLRSAWIFPAVIVVISLGAMVSLLKLKQAAGGGG